MRRLIALLALLVAVPAVAFGNTAYSNVFTLGLRSGTAPKASFSVTNTRPIPGETVGFVNASQNATRFKWSFGDGESSTEPNPLHSYIIGGDFTVSLEACNSQKTACSQATKNISVPRGETTIVGRVLDFDGGSIGESGTINFIKAPFGFLDSVVLSVRNPFSEVYGRWSYEDVPYGMYIASVHKGTPSSPRGFTCPSTGQYLETVSFLIEVLPDGPRSFELQLNCDNQNPWNMVLQRESTSCLFAKAGVTPGPIGTAVAAAAFAHSITEWDNAVADKRTCDAFLYGGSAVYTFANILIEAGTGGFDQIQDVLDLVVGCIAIPIGERVCDFAQASVGGSKSTQVAFSDDGSPSSFMSPSIAFGVDLLAVQFSSENEGLAMRLESAFGGAAVLSGGVFDSDVELPIWAESTGTEGHMMLMHPTGNEHLSLLCENSEGCGEVDLSVSMLSSSANYGRRFEVNLAEGESISASISEIIETRRMTVERDGGSEEQLPQAACIDSAPSRWALSGVAHLAGANQSEWRTDLDIVNVGDAPADYALEYRETGNAFPIGVVTGSLMAGEGVHLDDLVEDELGKATSAGWLELTSNTEMLVMTQRTFSDSPDGTQGLAVPSFRMEPSEAPSYHVAGIEKNDEFRTNLILLNSTSTSNTATLQFSSSETVGTVESAVEINQHEQHQINDIVRFMVGSGITTSTGKLKIRFERPGGLAYATKIDNSTNDPLIVLPATQRDFFIPAVAKTSGAEGSQWRTDLQVAQIDGAESAILELELWPLGNTATVELPPGLQTQSIDVFDVVGVSEGVGMLEVKSDREVSAVVRVYSTDGEKNFGLGMQVIPWRESPNTLHGGQAGHLVGLRQNTDFRTNLAIQNYGDETADLTLTAFGIDGLQLGAEKTVSIPPHDFVQFNKVLTREFGVSNKIGVRLELLCTTGEYVGAYATIVDNKTNDGTFVPLQR